MRWTQYNGQPDTLPPEGKRMCKSVGCDKPVHAKGLCKVHYNKQLLESKPKPEKAVKPTDGERFNSKFNRAGDSECWEWEALLDRDGYGIFKVGRRAIGAHRFARELSNGPIPPGMKVCHACDNPRCVNPAHLFIGTQRENMLDMKLKGRSTRGEANHSSKLSESDIQKMISDYSLGIKNGVQLAKEYNICFSWAYRILRRESWKHVVAV